MAVAHDVWLNVAVVQVTEAGSIGIEDEDEGQAAGMLGGAVCAVT